MYRDGVALGVATFLCKLPKSAISSVFCEMRDDVALVALGPLVFLGNSAGAIALDPAVTFRGWHKYKHHVVAFSHGIYNVNLT